MGLSEKTGKAFMAQFVGSFPPFLIHSRMCDSIGIFVCSPFILALISLQVNLPIPTHSSIQIYFIHSSIDTPICIITYHDSLFTN